MLLYDVFGTYGTTYPPKYSIHSVTILIFIGVYTVCGLRNHQKQSQS